MKLYTVTWLNPEDLGFGTEVFRTKSAAEQAKRRMEREAREYANTPDADGAIDDSEMSQFILQEHDVPGVFARYE